jgi:hypothetical protein
MTIVISISAIFIDHDNIQVYRLSLGGAYLWEEIIYSNENI